MRIEIQLDGRESGRTEKGYPIIVYASENYKQKKWRTGHFSKKNEWNARLCAPNQKHPDYYMLLDYLGEIKIIISKILSGAANHKVSLEEVKERIFKKNHTVFHDAAMASFPEGYRGTKWSAIRSFDHYYKGVSFYEVSPRNVEAYIAALLKKGNSPGGDRLLCPLLAGHVVQIVPRTKSVRKNEDRDPGQDKPGGHGKGHPDPCIRILVR